MPCLLNATILELGHSVAFSRVRVNHLNSALFLALFNYLSFKTQKLDPPVGQHFNLPNHSISDMILQGIEALANRKESVRLSREKMWIKRVHTIHPHGLNIQEGND